MGVFIPQNLANATNQDFFLLSFLFSFPFVVAKLLPAHYCLIQYLSPLNLTTL